MGTGEILANWSTYSTKTQLVTIGAGLAFFISLGMGVWSHYLRESDKKAGADESQRSVKFDVTPTVNVEIHNHYPPGTEIDSDEVPLDGWQKSLLNGKAYFSRTDREVVDLGVVEIKTIAVLDDDNVVQWRYRIFSILEGAAWDINSWKIFRNADGEELSLEVLLTHKRIKEQIDFSDIVFAIGLASNLEGETAAENLLLSRKRAEWLAKAVARFSIVSGRYRWSTKLGADPSRSTIYGKVYMVPLGEAKKETSLGDPDEPLQRAAIVVGVDINKKDPDIEEMLSFVVAPGVSVTTDLSAYMLSDKPATYLREIRDPRSSGEVRSWPEDYSVAEPPE